MGHTHLHLEAQRSEIGGEETMKELFLFWQKKGVGNYRASKMMFVAVQ
jgi:hypothetical protein